MKDLATTANGHPGSFDRRAVPPGMTESEWRTPDGHPLRAIDWPAVNPRGTLLFLGGRADFAEKYLEAMAHWHETGWHVCAFDWRGQGASGRLGADPFTGHIDDYPTWIADLAAFWAAHVKAAPAVVVGHSMGGHIALRAAAEGAIDPAALVLVAPMLGIRGPLPDAAMHWIARAMSGVGDNRRPAWKWSDKPGVPPTERGKLLTHDPARYEDELWWREQRPDLSMGPGSWRWVERSYASIRELARADVLAKVRQPVLILGTSQDRLVSWKHSLKASQLLPQAEIVDLGPRARHEILREADPVRSEALAYIDAFLDRATQ